MNCAEIFTFITVIFFLSHNKRLQAKRYSSEIINNNSVIYKSNITDGDCNMIQPVSLILQSLLCDACLKPRMLRRYILYNTPSQ